VRRIAFNDLAQVQTVRTYTFDHSVEGWQFVTLPGYFSAPSSAHRDGALQITATSNYDNFGFWASPTTDLHIEANKLYRGRFTVSSNLTDLSKAPTVRFRLTTSNSQATRALEIISGTDGANSPGQEATTYDVYFFPPQHLVGTPNDRLVVGFDLMNFTPQDSSSATVALDSVSIESLDLPHCPSCRGNVPHPGHTRQAVRFSLRDRGSMSRRAILFCNGGKQNCPLQPKMRLKTVLQHAGERVSRCRCRAGQFRREPSGVGLRMPRV